MVSPSAVSERTSASRSESEEGVAGFSGGGAEGSSVSRAYSTALSGAIALPSARAASHEASSPERERAAASRAS